MVDRPDLEFMQRLGKGDGGEAEKRRMVRGRMVGYNRRQRRMRV